MFGRKNLSPRQTMKIAAQDGGDVPFFYVPGPVYNIDAGLAAIYHTTLQKPFLRVVGGGYPTQRQFRTLQPPQLFAQPAVTVQGIGIQNGQLALAMLTEDDGSYEE